MLSGSGEKRETESAFPNQNSQQQLSQPCEFEWQQFMEWYIYIVFNILNFFILF